jgi:glycosyltransferase involved in cell wall biosynthesis
MQISACLIVKNEEQNIRHCLDSIVNCVDEIIITDTGSTDGTLGIINEYAENYNMKIFVDEWRNDFSFHRNETIKHATGDWILVIDADEELINGIALKELLPQVEANINACRITLYDMQNGNVSVEFDSDRIFRNGKIRYEGIVHNSPVWGDNRVCYLKNIALRHYGYDISEEKKQAKFERTTSLLLKSIEKTPGDYSAYRYLGASASFAGKSADAIKYLDIYISNTKGKPHFNPSAWFELANEYYHQENYRKCDETIAEALKYDPENLDIHYLKFQLANRFQDVAGSVIHGQKYIELFQAYREGKNRHFRFIYTLKPEAMLTAVSAVKFYYEQYINKLSVISEMMEKEIQNGNSSKCKNSV